MKKLCIKNSLPLYDKELSLNYLFLYLYFMLNARAAELNINAINIIKSFSSPVFGLGFFGFGSGFGGLCGSGSGSGSSVIFVITKPLF